MVAMERPVRARSGLPGGDVGTTWLPLAQPTGRSVSNSGGRFEP